MADLAIARHPDTVLLGGRRKKPINKAGESPPVGKLAITLGPSGASALHDDEFDDLLLEVVIFGEAQSTPEKKGHARLPTCHSDKVIDVLLCFCLRLFQNRRQTDGYGG